MNPGGEGNLPISEAEISGRGSVVHLKGYGFIRVFGIVSKDGGIEHWATNDLGMDESSRLKYSEISWSIENYHRCLKQYCGVEKARVRASIAQRNHICCAVRAFLRFDFHFQKTGVNWFEAKTSIAGEAVRVYLTNPYLNFQPTALVAIY